MESEKLLVKENVVRQAPLSLGWLTAACALAGSLLAVAALLDLTLPEPLTRGAPPHRFIAEIAHNHLVNLTSIGPRVAGSYENEVLAVGVIVSAVREITRSASPHVRIELDVQTASGAFPLDFLDGMNHIYQDVSNVVVRLSAAGSGGRLGGGGAGGGGEGRSALLLNCHIDTVPDSPGASDDGAGCAVMLETLRALSTARSPPRHAAIFLFNAAEENVLQASHGFITHHKWAKQVRAFINIEACGAGGREVMFQAGPHDPWIVETYAGAVPHPFASSLAQELFESGLIPADTDFRIFRDFGNLSGVDLAWSSNGYVYHTSLDTADRVSPAVLQRTGDNVLALARGILSHERLSSVMERTSRQPVFFDIVGVVVVSARAPAALFAAVLALLLVIADIHLAAEQAKKELYITVGGWWRASLYGMCVCACALWAGLAAAGGVASLLHAAGARLSFYSRPLLLAPLYAAPALAASWSTALYLSVRRFRSSAGLPLLALHQQGWWNVRMLQHGGTLLAAVLLSCACAQGLRSGFLPALWAALPAIAGLLSTWTGSWRHLVRSHDSPGLGPGWWWMIGGLLPSLQTWYLTLGSLRMLVPIAGRAGSTSLPPDVMVGVVTGALTLVACSWLLPLVCAARRPHLLIWSLCGVCLCVCMMVILEPAQTVYSSYTPQRLMIFHTRRTVHSSPSPSPSPISTHMYWVPEMDVNTLRTIQHYVPMLREATSMDSASCASWPYCGAPYYFPALGLVRGSLSAPAPPLPPHSPAILRATLTRDHINNTHALLHLRILQGPAHVVIVMSPGVGVRVSDSNVLGVPLGSKAPPPDPGRNLYFISMHSARRAHSLLTLVLERYEDKEKAVTDGTLVSIAGHALFGDRSSEHEGLLRSLPDWIAPTGWAVDLHLYSL